MIGVGRIRHIVAAALVFLTPGVGVAADGRPVAVLAWADGLDPDLLATFERQTGTSVLVDTYATTDALIDALHTGRYDAVMLSADALPAVVKAGLLAPAPARPPDLAGDLAERLASVDAGGPHAVPFAWFGTTLVMQADKLRDRHAAIVPAEGWGAVLKPEVLRRVADCGVAAPSDGRDLYAAALGSVARDATAPDAVEVRRAQAVVAAVRPIVRRIAEPELIDGLATGELCLGLVSEAAAWQVADRAAAASTPAPITVAPQPGGRLFIDVLALSSTSPNRAAAERLVAFLLRPESANRNAAFAHVHSAVVAPDAEPTAVAADRAMRADLILLPDDDPAVARLRDAGPRKAR